MIDVLPRENDSEAEAANSSNRGAAAVEFALVLPLLLLLLGGIIDFGFAFNTQISLTHAAREGVRHYAIHEDEEAAKAVALAAFTAPVATDAEADVVRMCPSEEGARVVVTANSRLFFSGLLPFVDNQLPLEGQAVMRCGA